MEEFIAPLSPALVFVGITLVVQILKELFKYTELQAKKASFWLSLIGVGGYHLLATSEIHVPELIASAENSGVSNATLVFEILMFVTWTLFGIIVYTVIGWASSVGLYTIGKGFGVFRSTDQIRNGKS